MIFERRFLYRISPYLQLGILIEDNIFRYWKSSHFKKLDNRVLRKWGSSKDTHILYSEHHVEFKLEENQQVIWLDPTIQNLDFTLTPLQHRVLNEQFFAIQTYYPNRKLRKTISKQDGVQFHLQYENQFVHVQFVELRARQSHVVGLQPKRIYVEPTSGGKKRPFLLDSGCEQTCINSDSWDSTWEIVHQEHNIPSSIVLVNASGDELRQQQPPTYVKLKFGYIETTQKVFVVDDLKTNLLGLDWISANRVSIICDKDANFKLQIGNHPEMIPTRCQLKLNVHTINSTSLEPGEHQLKCRVDSKEILYVQVHTFDALAIPQVRPQTYRTENGFIWLTVNNPLDQRIYLDSNFKVGTAMAVKGEQVIQNNRVYLVDKQE